MCFGEESLDCPRLAHFVREAAPQHLHAGLLSENVKLKDASQEPAVLQLLKGTQPAAPELSSSEVRPSRQRAMGMWGPHPQLFCSSDPLLRRSTC